MRKACPDFDPGLDSSKKMQSNIFSSMCATNPQDDAAFSMMEMVTKEDVSPHKLSKESFRKHLNFDPLNYRTFVDLMLELTWVVNKKLAVEMADNKGTILHDAWTRYGRNYLAL